MPRTAADRSADARIAALSRSAKTDGAAISEPARSAFRRSFDTGGQECSLCGRHPVIDPGLPGPEIARRSAAAFSAHMGRVSRKARRSAAVIAEQSEQLAAAAEQLASEAV